VAALLRLLCGTHGPEGLYSARRHVGAAWSVRHVGVRGFSRAPPPGCFGNLGRAPLRHDASGNQTRPQRSPGALFNRISRAARIPARSDFGPDSTGDAARAQTMAAWMPMT